MLVCPSVGVGGRTSRGGPEEGPEFVEGSGAGLLAFEVGSALVSVQTGRGWLGDKQLRDLSGGVFVHGGDSVAHNRRRCLSEIAIPNV